MILKQAFNSSKSAKPKVTKNPLMATDYNSYTNGQNKPIGYHVYSKWINQVSSLRNVLATTAELASGANIKFYKVDSKGKKKLILNPKQFDTMFMNDIDDVSSFLYNYFGQIKAYDNVLIIPEESKYPYRQGKVDFFIADNKSWKANPNTTGKQTIETFTYTSTQGTETTYNYDDVIFIRKPLTSSNLLYGVSRLQSLNEEISRILNMGDYVDGYIASGAKKAVVVGTDEPMSPSQQDDILEALNKFLYNPKQKALMLNAEKLSIKEISESLASTDVVNFLVKLNKTVLEAYNMPKFFNGDYSDTSNAELVRLSTRIFFECAIKPEYLRLGRHLTRYARDILNIKNLSIEIDFSGLSLLERSAKETMEITSEQLKLGAISHNEFREQNGYETIDLEAMDKHYVGTYITSSQPIRFENFEEDINRRQALENEVEQISGMGGANNNPDENGVS